MFAPDSRYAGLPVATYTDGRGREVAYVRRRLLPRTRDLHVIGRVLVEEGDRLDLISARTSGDPLQYWRLCDANEAMNPAELVAEPGRHLLVAEVG